MIKTGSAAWKGNLKEGTGTISTETGLNRLVEWLTSIKER